MLPGPPRGETWIGDDAATVRADDQLLLAADVLVEGTHFDLGLSTPADVGWKAVAVNVSDIAAMGGRATHLLITVVVPADRSVVDLYDGIVEASARWECPVVGGDLSQGPALSISVTAVGTTDGRPPVLRSGARAGDAVLVTGPLGRAAAELHAFWRGEAGPGLASGSPGEAPGEAARPLGGHRRPLARVAEGVTAAGAGATAMIDVSDGLLADLGHILDRSGVGVRLDAVPVADGATEEEALTGGDDYELVLTTPDPGRVVAAFTGTGLREPVLIGECVADPAERLVRGATVPADGWQHRFA